MQIHLIVAMSENRVIGREGQLPWHLSADLKRVKVLTMGYPIIMGRKNYESIGRLLPGRVTVILTRNRDFRVEGALVFHDLDEAIGQLSEDHDLAFVFGGVEVYHAALPRVDRIYLTQIHEHVAGDAYFPPLPAGEFVETHRESHDEPMRFSFITFDRVAGA